MPPPRTSIIHLAVRRLLAGGVVACTNDTQSQLLDIPECLLLQHGAASEEAAVAMATGDLPAIFFFGGMDDLAVRWPQSLLFHAVGK